MVWQPHTYIDDLDMVSLIRFHDYLLGTLTDELDLINTTNSIFLTITHYEETRILGILILQKEYFLNAMKRVEQYIDSPHYLVFAQDMVSAGKHIGSSCHITYTSKKEPHEETI